MKKTKKKTRTNMRWKSIKEFLTHIVSRFVATLFSFDLCVSFLSPRSCYFVWFNSLLTGFFLLCHFAQLFDWAIQHQFDWLFFNNVNKMFYYYWVCVHIQTGKRHFFVEIFQFPKTSRKKEKTENNLKKVRIEMKKNRNFTKENRQHW